MSKDFHCPRCKSKDIHCMVTNETNVSSTGGGYGAGKGCLGYLLLGPLGLLCGACGSKQKITTENKQSTIWACKSCGEKFRDIEEINSQISELSSSNILSSPLALITTFTIVGIVMSIILNTAGLFVFYLIFGILVSVLRYYVDKNKVEKSLSALYEERNYIMKNAYNNE